MNVLIADDSTLIRRLIEVAVADRGHEMMSVEDGAAAWEVFEREHPSLVILDWQMPELDGLEVCRRIRNSPWARDTFVLVVTGRIEGDDVVNALDAGADDYLFKPFTPPTITARLAIAERRIAANEARWAAEEALANAQWMAGIGQTALAIQHEVNNPLAALLGNVQLMLMDENLPADVRDLGDDMLAQARRVANVVKRLSTLEAPQTVEYLTGATMLDLSERNTR
ncbi:MAG TPA: response regulator [Gemmatimonadaceae bacterium]|jgi:DNA-binding response OmpR family regulator|nr:response regulator [Gemmatimonadaceae bacterium]